MKLLFFLTLLCSAVPGLSNAAAPGDKPSAAVNELLTQAHWLERIQQAPHQLNYQGTFVYQQGLALRTARIVHRVEAGHLYERIESLDGQPHEVVRHNHEIHFLSPTTKTVLVEPRTEREIFPGVLRAPPQTLLKYYQVRQLGTDRVAGLETDVLHLQPKDQWRYSYRLWSAREHGLLLKIQTLNEQNQVIEQTAFSEIHVGGKIDAQALKSGYNTQGWKTEQLSPLSDSAALSTYWTVMANVPGFVKISEMRRNLAGQAVTQLVFSDGLATVSVFIEPWREGKAVNETVGSQGAVNMLSRRYQDWALTTLGAVPVATLRQLSQAVQFNSGKK